MDIRAVHTHVGIGRRILLRTDGGTDLRDARVGLFAAPARRDPVPVICTRRVLILTVPTGCVCVGFCGSDAGVGGTADDVFSSIINLIIAIFFVFCC